MGFRVVQIVELPGMPDYGEIFKQAGVDVDFVKNILPLAGVTDNEVTAAVKDAEAVITISSWQPFSRQVIESMSRCRLIMSIGIGYDLLDVKAATDQVILAANIPDASLEEMSDHTMALILACTRRLLELNDMVRAGNWKSEPDSAIQQRMLPKMSRLRGQTLGLLGFGGIPRAMVPKAKGFGMKLMAYDPYVAPKVFEDLGVESVTLDELLLASDVLSVHAPLTSETRHMLGTDQFKKMKTTAYLINTARGPIVEERALYSALSEGHIAGAAVDVADPEPMSPDNPLLKLDNFMITPHAGSFSPMFYGALVSRPPQEIIRFLKGDWPKGLLNPQIKEAFKERWKI